MVTCLFIFAVDRAAQEGVPGAIPHWGLGDTSQRSSPADEVEQDHNDGDHKKNVDETAQRV
jgi:hypothetical protein